MTEATDRGRHAERPRDIPKPGWREILKRTMSEVTADHVSIVSAGVAFFGLLAIFPGIAALVSIAGMILDPATVEQQVAQLSGVLPEDAASILQDQAAKVASGQGAAGLAAVVGLLLTLYSASKGTKSLMEGMNIAYDEDEKRNLIKLNVVALVLTLGLILGFAVALAVTVAAPALLGSMGLSSGVQTAVNWLRWPLLGVFAILGLAVLYRYGPSRADPKWRWVTPGAVIATILWVAGSILFSVYVRNFGSYNATYGALGGVIILLMWFWLSSFIVLLGAELNSEMEHQTARDSTTGKPRPRGERGAVKADTLPRKD